MALPDASELSNSMAQWASYQTFTKTFTIMQDIEKSVNEVLESIYNDAGNVEDLEICWIGTDEEFEEFAKTLLSTIAETH
jgi:hypothetical protein